MFRHADGSVDAGHETHRTGLFPRATWTRLLAAAGFTVEVVAEVTTEDRTPRELFVGHRPGQAAQGAGGAAGASARSR